MTVHQEIDDCIRREAEQRAATRAAADPDSRDDHFMRAERLADRAWSLGERFPVSD